ncbi:hypothetical protein IG631_04593 [Alternaria alternata]|nr:hypothetical protein IG631_04593 [Alternaria alternata]
MDTMPNATEEFEKRRQEETRVANATTRRNKVCRSVCYPTNARHLCETLRDWQNWAPCHS